MTRAFASGGEDIPSRKRERSHSYIVLWAKKERERVSGAKLRSRVHSPYGDRMALVQSMRVCEREREKEVGEDPGLPV